jgi:hypothetical protein
MHNTGYFWAASHEVSRVLLEVTKLDVVVDLSSIYGVLPSSKSFGNVNTFKMKTVVICETHVSCCEVTAEFSSNSEIC